MAEYCRRASALQRNLFVTRIFEGGRSIVNPQLWLDTGRGVGQMVTRLAALFANWCADVSGHANFAGLALIPLELYFLRGRAKLQLALGKGKKAHDKREDLKRKEANREVARAMSWRGRK